MAYEIKMVPGPNGRMIRTLVVTDSEVTHQVSWREETKAQRLRRQRKPETNDIKTRS